VRGVRIRFAAFGAGAAILAGVAGCSSSSSGGSPPAGTSTTPAPTSTVTVSAAPSPSTSPSASGSATPTPVAAAPGCTTRHLKLSLGQGQGAAGSTYQPIVFTNIGSKPCSLVGYPGVSFVDSGGHQLGKPSSHQHVAAHPVDVPAGGSASALLQLPDPGVFSPANCEQTTASELKVYPPNQTAALQVADQAMVCTTATGRTSVRPVVAGSSGE
jgi:hypothetical protein